MKRSIKLTFLSTSILLLVLGQNWAYSGTRDIRPSEKLSTNSKHSESNDITITLENHEIDTLKSKIVSMFEKLNSFNFQEFTTFFSSDSLSLLKHNVLSHSNSNVFKRIFPEGKIAARELSPNNFFIRIVSKSKLNVGITRPYSVSTLPELKIDANPEGDIATVTAIFPDAYNPGREHRSETLLFRKRDGEWLPEPPDFIVSSFKYDLLEEFTRQHVYYPFSPFITDGFKLIYNELP